MNSIGSPLEMPLLFPESLHSPYLLNGGRPAALLVHGFPGTPNEVRSLADALHQAGWTVHGLLLPGFGPEFSTIEDKKYEEWVEAVSAALFDLRQAYSPVLLVGFSMGAAVSIKAAVLEPPDGLVLLAPFLWIDAAWQRLLLPVMHFILPQYVRPFRWMDFANPQIRLRAKKFLKQVDLENPEVRLALNQFCFPLAPLVEIYRAGVEAAGLLGQLNGPVMVVQGRKDLLVWPRRTRKLLKRFHTQPIYIELDADHHLLDPGASAWPVVKQSVLDFAGTVINL